MIKQKLNIIDATTCHCKSLDVYFILNYCVLVFSIFKSYFSLSMYGKE